MSDRSSLDKIMQIAEELSSTRTRIENSMVNLKSQLITLKETLDVTIHELETHGMDAPLNRVINIDEKSMAIVRNVRQIKQQSASLDQALAHVKSAKKLSTV
jgi:riboflavin synthase